MLVNVENKKIKIWFNYETKNDRRVTHCELRSHQDGEIVGYGIVCQSSKDPDVKFLARKHALAKALTFNFSRQSRKIIWDQYLNQVKVPKRQK